MNHADVSFEDNYIRSTDPAWRKKFGQIFTPPAIAHLMISWVTANMQGGRLLDPALGPGIFYRELAAELAKSAAESPEDASDSTFVSSLLSSFDFEGFELDPNLAELTRDAFTTLGIPLQCYAEDFLFAHIVRPYDGIVCNPPYIHFQDYKYHPEFLQEFTRLYGLELNKLSNIYALFLVKALSLLKPGGRAAFIVPSEFLNADYGIGIKEFLLATRALTHLIIFDPALQIFPGFLTTSAILLFEKSAAHQIQMINLSTLSELPTIQNYLLNPVESYGLKVKNCDYSALDPKVKWKNYYADTTAHLHLEKKTNLTRFSKFANVRRGIATGANEFFTLSAEDAREHRIDRVYLSPCLTRASQLQDNFFCEADLERLIAAGKKVFLLNLTNKLPDKHVLAYIRRGEELGFHTRYLTRNRRLWYTMEPLTPADILVKTFNREPAVFVANHTATLHLTCFHGIYLNPLGQEYREALFLYLLTDLAREVFEGYKRDYGLGLGKFEPNDIKEAHVLDFTTMSSADLATLVALYQEYVTNYHSGKKICTEILAQVERTYLRYW